MQSGIRAALAGFRASPKGRSFTSIAAGLQLNCGDQSRSSTGYGKGFERGHVR